MMSNSIVRGLSVVSSPPNGVARAVTLLAPLWAKVDHLAELRDLLRRSHEAERELAAEIQQTLTAAPRRRARGSARQDVRGGTRTATETSMRRAALYARVSTLEQTPENQLVALRTFALARGWAVSEFIDHGVSGAKDRRPQLDAMLADVRRRKFDLVLVTKLDR